jgi:transposase-like protein
MEPTNQEEVPKLSQVIQIDEGKIQEHLGEAVRSRVEETLNAMLDAEADRLCRAERYERTEARKDTRAGSYQRHLQTKAGEVTLKVRKLRNLPFETAIIDRYRRRESSVRKTLDTTKSKYRAKAGSNLVSTRKTLKSYRAVATYSTSEEVERPGGKLQRLAAPRREWSAPRPRRCAGLRPSEQP